MVMNIITSEIRLSDKRMQNKTNLTNWYESVNENLWDHTDRAVLNFL